MNKKIMILNGSPRRNVNTAELIHSFTDGAIASGNTVTCFDLQKMNINFCHGCFGGGRNAVSLYVQKDDME